LNEERTGKGNERERFVTFERGKGSQRERKREIRSLRKRRGQVKGKKERDSCP